MDSRSPSDRQLLSAKPREAALSGAQVYRAELLADGDIAGGEHAAGLSPTLI